MRRALGHLLRLVALPPLLLKVRANLAHGSHALAQTRVRAKLRGQAQDFEAMFLGQMMEPMFAGLKSEAPFGGGHAEETWRSFLVQEYGKTIAKRGGVGIAKMVESQMLDMAGLGAKNKLPPTGQSDATSAPKALA